MTDEKSESTKATDNEKSAPAKPAAPKSEPVKQSASAKDKVIPSPEVQTNGEKFMKNLKSQPKARVLRSAEFVDGGPGHREALNLIQIVDPTAYTVRDIYASVDAIVSPATGARVRKGDTVQILTGRGLKIVRPKKGPATD